MSTDACLGSGLPLQNFPVVPSKKSLGCWTLVSEHSRSPWAVNYLVHPAERERARNYYLLKTLPAGLHEQTRWEAIDRLARRVVLAEGLNHSGLPPILDAELDAPPFFLVTPFIHAQTLEKWRNGKTTPGISAALWIARQLADVLNAAHHLAKTHLGLAPDKILIDDVGRATLCGWGNSHNCDQRAWLPTTGTDPRTRAPETYLSDYRAQPGADVYSLGAIMYWMFTGVWPINTLSAESRQSVVNAHPPDFSRLENGGCPTAMIQLLQRMLFKNPLRRPAMNSVLDQLVSIEIDHLSDLRILADRR